MKRLPLLAFAIIALLWCDRAAHAQPSFGIPQSADINISSATTTKVISAPGQGGILILHYHLISGGTGNVTLEYGTQASTPCDTGAVVLAGPYPLTAQAGLVVGDGSTGLMYVPPSNMFCIVTSGSATAGGAVAWVQR